MKLIVEMEMPKNMCCDCEISIDGFACKKSRMDGGKCPIVGVLPDEPTVDTVPVVRCKNCRWACLAPQRQTATCMKARLSFTHGYDWFCADGERRTDEQQT